MSEQQDDAKLAKSEECGEPKFDDFYKFERKGFMFDVFSSRVSKSKFFEVRVLKKNTKKVDTIVKKERTVMGITHPNILKFLELYNDRENYCFVSKGVTTGTLKNEFQKMKEDENCEPTQLALWFQRVFLHIVNGLLYLHGYKAYFRNLNPQNCIFKDNYAKLVNFEYSRSYKKDFTRFWDVQSKYTPPECMKSGFMEIDPEKAEVWSLAVTFIEILTGKQLFSNVKKVVELNDEFEDDQKMSAYKKKLEDVFLSIKKLSYVIDESIVDLLRNCLIFDAKTRYTMNQVLGHEYFTKYVLMTGTGEPPLIREVLSEFSGTTSRKDNQITITTNERRIVIIDFLNPDLDDLTSERVQNLTKYFKGKNHLIMWHCPPNEPLDHITKLVKLMVTISPQIPHIVLVIEFPTAQSIPIPFYHASGVLLVPPMIVFPHQSNIEEIGKCKERGNVVDKWAYSLASGPGPYRMTKKTVLEVLINRILDDPKVKREYGVAILDVVASKRYFGKGIQKVISTSMFPSECLTKRKYDDILEDFLGNSSKNDSGVKVSPINLDPPTDGVFQNSTKHALTIVRKMDTLTTGEVKKGNIDTWDRVKCSILYLDDGTLNVDLKNLDNKKSLIMLVDKENAAIVIIQDYDSLVLVKKGSGFIVKGKNERRTRVLIEDKKGNLESPDLVFWIRENQNFSWSWKLGHEKVGNGFIGNKSGQRTISNEIQRGFTQIDKADSSILGFALEKQFKSKLCDEFMI